MEKDSTKYVFGGMEVEATFGGGWDSVVYIIEKDTITGTWSQTGSIKASDGAGFGKAIDIHQNTIVIGAPESDIVSGTEGEAYIITKQPGGWPTHALNDEEGVQTLRASDGTVGDKFGSSVNISIFNARDLFLGKVFNLVASFTFDATNLGVGK